MDGIKDDESSLLELTAFNVKDAAGKYVQLVDESTGNQAACCMVDWLYNQDLGKSREEIRAERDQRRQNEKRGNTGEIKDWSASARQEAEKEAELVEALSQEAESQEADKDKKLTREERRRRRRERRRKRRVERKNRNEDVAEIETETASSFAGFNSDETV